MNLAAPIALAWAALAVPIIVFYILKVRLRRVPVSTTMFWQQIFEDKPPRSIWETLKHLLSLLVQITLLLLLVTALTEPYFSWELLAARKVVLVVDNSGSLRATDVSPNRFSQAIEQGLRSIDGMRFHDQMAIIVAGTEPNVACGMTGHLRTLKNALTSIPQSDGPTHLKEAVELGQRLIGDHAHGKVIVLTDGCSTDAEEVSQNPKVQMQLVGKSSPNVGITRFQVRRSLLDSLGYEILMEVLNASDEPVECRLEIELNEKTVDVIPLKLKPGQKWNHTLEKTSIQGGHLVGKLLHDDPLPIDNQAWAILPTREVQPVIIVTSGNLFLQKVFEANALMSVQVTKELPSSIPLNTLLVLHRQVPSTLPPGNILVIDPQGECDLWELGSEIPAPLITQQSKTSPVMTHVKLDNVQMPTAQQMKFRGAVEVLAGSVSGDPIFAAINRPAGKVLVLSANLDEGDLAFRTAFPILVSNSIGWFRGQSGELRESLTTGSTTEVELSNPKALSSTPTPKSEFTYDLKSPQGTVKRLPSNVEKLTIGPLDECGIWSIIAKSADSKAPSPPAIELACNLANERESDLRAPESLKAASDQNELIIGWFHRPIWFYLIATAWILVTAEWFLYQRRYLS